MSTKKQLYIDIKLKACIYTAHAQTTTTAAIATAPTTTARENNGMKHGESSPRLS